MVMSLTIPVIVSASIGDALRIVVLNIDETWKSGKHACISDTW
jgi:hypothetical protein